MHSIFVSSTSIRPTLKCNTCFVELYVRTSTWNNNKGNIIRDHRLKMCSYIFPLISKSFHFPTGMPHITLIRVVQAFTHHVSGNVYYAHSTVTFIYRSNIGLWDVRCFFSFGRGCRKCEPSHIPFTLFP